MNKIKCFFKLIRCSNLLMIALMTFLVYYCLMLPMFKTGIVGAVPSSPAFILLVISLLFIVAGGYVINDYFDVEIDKINKPDKLIVSRVFSENVTKFFYITLTFLGLLSGLLSSIMILNSRFYLLFAILFLLVCMLYSYSAYYKKKLIVGNLIVSVSVAFAVFLPWLFEILYLSNNTLILYAVGDTLMLTLPYVLIYTIFAFFMTMMREIIKDAEDFKGDLVTRCRTIPIVLGIKKMNIILGIIVFLLWAVILYYQMVLYYQHSYFALSIMFIIWISLPISIIKLFNKKVEIDYHSYSVFLKIIMLLGVLSMIFI